MSKTSKLALHSVVVIAAVVGLAAPGRGQSAASRITWSPTTGPALFDYGGVSSASQEFTLANPGGPPSGALTIDVLGSPTFTMTVDGCIGSNLTSHQSCRVIVEYAPAASCQRDWAVLRATGKKGATVASIDLTGTSPDVNTTLTSAAAAGATNLMVKNVSDICAGQTIVVGDASNVDARTVVSIGLPTTVGTPIALTLPLTHAHAVGESAVFITP